MADDTKQKATELIEELAKRNILLIQEDRLSELEDIKEAVEKWLEVMKAMSNYHDTIKLSGVLDVFNDCLNGKCPGE